MIPFVLTKVKKRTSGLFRQTNSGNITDYHGRTVFDDTKRKLSDKIIYKKYFKNVNIKRTRKLESERGNGTYHNYTKDETVQ